MKMTFFWIQTIGFLFSFSSLAQQDPSIVDLKSKLKTSPPEGIESGIDKTLVDNVNPSPIQLFDHDHVAFTKILKTYVVDKGATSEVKYDALKTNKLALEKYLTELTHVSQKQFDQWNPQQQQSFLINAYNAFTLKLIIDHYPVKSIKDIGGLFSSPWKKEFFEFLDKKRSLDWIEHEVLRKKYKEPRIHFAVNCASIGCPKLLNQAYTATNLNRLLEEQTRTFLQDKTRNRINGKELVLSKIFDWFEEDFEKSHGSVQKFVANYISDDPFVREKIRQGKFDIDYSDYNWKLNSFK